MIGLPKICHNILIQRSFTEVHESPWGVAMLQLVRLHVLLTAHSFRPNNIWLWILQIYVAVLAPRDVVLHGHELSERAAIF